MSVKTYDFMIPQIIRFGVGARETLADEAKKIKVKKPLIVTDPGIAQSGLVDPVKQQLSRAGLSVEVYSDSEPEPTLSRLDAAAKKFREYNYDLLVGLGGGSSIDTAKGLSVLLTHGGSGKDYLGTNKVPGPCIPVFALPTTAGTGSEATNIAVFSDTEKQLKLSIVSPYILARLALVDPVFTYNCPAKVTAASGMDALVHAIECYTSTKANNFTDAIALHAMELIAGNLRTVVNNGADEEARNNMAEGALLAGIAFSNSGVAAVHALAYPLGVQFHVAHGVANGILLPYVMEQNFAANLERYAVVAEMLGEDIEGVSLRQAAKQGVTAVQELLEDIGFPLHLRELGVPEEALEGMAVATMDITRLLNNNPKKLTLENVKSIWEHAW